MPPPLKRARVTPSSPLKQSSTAETLAATRDSTGSSSNSRPKRRTNTRDGGPSHQSTEDGYHMARQGVAEDDALLDASTGFLKASSGDAYLLQAATTSKTSDELLSDHIDSAFTIPEYTAELSAFDDLTALASRRESIQSKTNSYKRKYLHKWLWEMSQGFNILLHGFGSKRHVANAFAQVASSRGHVIVVNGYDPASTFGDLILALEEVVKAALRQAEEDAAEVTRKKGRKGKGRATPSKSQNKGKGKAEEAVPLPRQRPSVAALAPVLSAFESRTRRFIQSLAGAPSSMPPIYLVIHSLDSATLRPPKIMSLLALLAAQPRVHLLATIDHVRATLLFPTSMAVTRPPHMSNDRDSAGSHEQQDMTDVLQSIRTFCFVPYATPTFEPYTTEVLHSATLSHLLPPSIFPSALDAAMDGAGGGGGGTAGGGGSSGMTQSTLHVLASVTARAKRVFVRLAQEQLALFEALEEGARKRVAVTGPAARDGVAAPVVAVSLDNFKAICTDSLLASHSDQVDGLLAEFRDHNVVRGSTVPPAQARGEGGEDDGEDEDGGGDGGEWIWITLGMQGLEEVLEEVKEGED